MEIGVGLWTMQSTAMHPVNHAAAYLDLQRDAQLAEQLGFSAFWVAEHHFWYDGWCPAPLVAAAAAAAVTSTNHPHRYRHAAAADARRGVGRPVLPAAGRAVGRAV